MKLNIQKIFTKFRNALNNREDMLLLEVDKNFDEIFLDQNIIKQNENLPKKINISLEKVKLIDQEWDKEDKLNSLINDCINIENEIKEINNINSSIKKLNNYDNINIRFFPLEEQKISQFIEKINSFGKIINNKYYKYLKDSTIIDNDNNGYEFLIKEIENRNNEIKDFKLIYRGKRDGEEWNNFYDKCNGIENVILLIKSDNNCRFGGYTKVGFKHINNNAYKDNSAFVFSFDKKKYILLKKIMMQ